MSSDDFIDGTLLRDDIPHYTPLRPILTGSFNLSTAAIPFFQTVLSLDEVAKELELVENLPSDLRSNWRLEELFQREIDWERVRHNIFDGYLRRPNKLKFFNSLTVALLPIDENKKLDGSYGDTPTEPDLREQFKGDPWKVVNVGGVQVISNSRSPNGFLRWNPKRIFPATIDGQHRLASLQMLLHEGNLTKSQLDTKVSVIFLVIDPRIGFGTESLQLAQNENPILTVVREVFIDLNKHAEEVVRARQILLDDQEIESRCLRSILAARVGEEQAGTLPLGVVHWQHNVTAKFNTGKPTGPFITTVELLYAIVADLLNLSRPKDPLDEKQVRKFVRSIEDALSLSDFIDANPLKYQGLSPLISHVEKNHLLEGFEVPFVNLPSPYLRAAVDCFISYWRPLIVSVLSRFKPYREFIEKVAVRGGVNGDLAYWLVQPRKAQDQKKKEWGEEYLRIIDQPLEELSKLKNADWPFYAVFQKGLFRATSAAWRHFGVARGGRDRDMDLFVEKWIAFLDEIWQRGVLAVKAPLNSNSADRLWSGIALNIASATVRWSESSVQRISALLLIWWYYHCEGLQQPSSFLKAIRGKRSAERFPGAKEADTCITTGLRQALSHADENEELDPTELDKRVEKRMRDLIALAQNTITREAETKDDDESVAEPPSILPTENELAE